MKFNSDFTKNIEIVKKFSSNNLKVSNKTSGELLKSKITENKIEEKEIKKKLEVNKSNLIEDWILNK
jgi:hypothetical protein